MHRYHTQLKEDIQRLIVNKNKVEHFRPDEYDSMEDFIKCSAELSHYVNYTGDKEPIGKITGILHEQLPPPERFTEEQRGELSPLLEELMACFHFAFDFPEKVPHAMRYSFIRDFWSESHYAMTYGTSHIEFCSYDKEHCPFPGYCPACDEIAADYKAAEENPELLAGDLPF